MSETIAFTCPNCGVEVEADAASRGVASQCPSCEESIIIPPFGIVSGKKIGSFVVKKRLGLGGMGEVWLAYQESLDRDIALKLLSPALTNDAGFVERFLREAKMAAKFDHPNCIATYDAGVDDGIYFLATSFVNGEELETKLKREGKLHEEQALRIVRDVATALRDSWNKFEMIHRDIKPSNIMIDNDGVVKLMDMGLARSATGDSSLTMTGVVVGTPHYISPEQAGGGRDIDFRTDIYSLGGTLFHMVAGAPPFDAPTAMGVISKHMTEPIRNPSEINPEISPGCAALITKMMAKTPEERHGSWEEVIKDVDDVLDGKLAVPPAAGAPKKRRSKRLGCLVLSLVAGVLVLVALGIIAKNRRRRLTRNDEVSLLPSNERESGVNDAGKPESPPAIAGRPSNDVSMRRSNGGDAPKAEGPTIVRHSPVQPIKGDQTPLQAVNRRQPPRDFQASLANPRNSAGSNGESPFTDPKKKARFFEIIMQDTGYTFDEILHDEQLRKEFSRKTYPAHLAGRIHGRLRHLMNRHRADLNELSSDEKKTLKLVRTVIRNSAPEMRRPRPGDDKQGGRGGNHPLFDRRGGTPGQR